MRPAHGLLDGVSIGSFVVSAGLCHSFVACQRHHDEIGRPLVSNVLVACSTLPQLAGVCFNLHSVVILEWRTSRDGAQELAKQGLRRGKVRSLGDRKSVV